MKQDQFKEKFAEIKEKSLDVEETKKLIIKLKENLDKEFEFNEGEISKEEIWEGFIDDYFEGLEYRGESNYIYNRIIQHVALDRLINSEKADRYTYNEVMRKARNMERENEKNELYLSSNIKDTMIALVRSAIRYNPGISEKRIIQMAPEEKEKKDSELREKLIKNIQYFAGFINFNGFLDEYIEDANKALQELGLEDIKYLKRNPIPDEEYDENGNLVKDKEDIGVIDVFDSTFLEKMPVEDLILMNLSWESQYFHKRLEMEKAMFTIDTLDLYDVFINGSTEDIRKIDNRRIETALKKEMALTYVFNEKKEIAGKLEAESKNCNKSQIEELAMQEVLNSKLRKQYKKFLKDNGLAQDENIEDSLRNLNKEFDNIYSAGSDTSVLQGIILYLIENKALKLKKWGIIDSEKIFEDYESDINMVDIAIEHPGFRGPIVIETPKDLLNIINETCKINKELPKYKGYIDPKYCEIMAKLYIPATPFYKKTIKSKYKEQPSSKLIASLAGKAAKEER